MHWGEEGRVKARERVCRKRWFKGEGRVSRWGGLHARNGERAVKGPKRIEKGCRQRGNNQKKEVGPEWLPVKGADVRGKGEGEGGVRAEKKGKFSGT